MTTNQLLARLLPLDVPTTFRQTQIKIEAATVLQIGILLRRQHRFGTLLRREQDRAEVEERPCPAVHQRLGNTEVAAVKVEQAVMAPAPVLGVQVRALNRPLHVLVLLAAVVAAG